MISMKGRVVRDTGPLKIKQPYLMSITVGIHAEEGAERHGYAGGLDVYDVAKVNEFGGGRIPARKWLRGWLPQQKRKMIGLIREVVTPMVRRHKYRPEQLSAVAEYAAQTLTKRITSGQIKPVNAPATLARKRPETRPLIEAGNFVRAIRARVQHFGKNVFVTGPKGK